MKVLDFLNEQLNKDFNANEMEDFLLNKNGDCLVDIIQKLPIERQGDIEKLSNTAEGNCNKYEHDCDCEYCDYHACNIQQCIPEFLETQYEPWAEPPIKGQLNIFGEEVV